MKSQLSKSAEGRAQAADDATVEIDETNALTITDNMLNNSSDSRKRKKKEKKNKKKASRGNGNAAVEESDSDGEIEAQEEALLKGGKGLRAFEQKDLVTRAFAGDNVVRVSLPVLSYTGDANTFSGIRGAEAKGD